MGQEGKGTNKASFDIDAGGSDMMRVCSGFVKIQCGAALCQVARMYAYNNNNNDENVITLHSDSNVIIVACEKIVEGTVSIVQLAIGKLDKDGVVELDEEREAAMISNLLVVLCSD